MHRIGFLISDGFQIMALAAQSVFEYANMGMSEPFYGMAIYSVDGGDVRSSLGLPVATHAARADRRRYVDRRGRQRSARFAGAGRRRRVPAPHQRTRAADRRHLHGRVRAGRSRAARAARDDALGVRPRHAAVLSGDPRRGRPDLHRRRPDLDVGRDDGRPRPRTRDGGKDLGADAARSVAHKLVMHQRRAGGQSQHSEMLGSHRNPIGSRTR